VDTIGERVESLETKFAEFMTRLDYHIERLDRNIERLDRNIERLDRNIERLDRNYEELKREARQHTLEWAQLAERFGRFAEDIVAPNIPRLAREVFGITTPEFTGQRIEKQHTKDPSRFREFDLIYAGQGKVIVVETKATARVKYIDEFAEGLRELDAYFPEFKRHTVIPIFASLALNPDMVRRLSRLKIYGLALGERTMELVNLAEVSSRRR
jgi:regulator of replication initiation timing